MMQVAVEAEVDAFLGCARYERRDEQDRPGSRQGWQPPATVRITMGAVELQRPKLRGTDEAFCFRLFGAGVTRTKALESLVISGWVRGLSDRDIEAALAEVLGAEAALSKSTVSRIGQRLRTAWKTRDLSGLRVDYLFVDGSHFRMHPGAPAEPVLAAWGIDTDGRPVFVGLAPAATESTDARDDFFADLVARGLGAPLLGISDGVPGLCGAFDRVFPHSLRQRCLIHRARNVLAKVTKHDQTEVKADLWKVFDVGDTEPGDTAVAVATRQAGEFAAKWTPRYPAAVACVTDDLASLTVHLRFPAEHHQRIRHSNFIESTFATVRLRTRVTKGPGSRAAGLAMAFKLIEAAEDRWRYAPKLVALVRAGFRFERGVLVESVEAAA
jgi:putative transposase